MLCTVTLKNNVLYFNNIVALLFSVFDLGARATCDTNYLEIHNVDQVTGKSSFVSKYCGGVSLSFVYYSFTCYYYYSLLCCEYKARKKLYQMRSKSQYECAGKTKRIYYKNPENRKVN